MKSTACLAVFVLAIYGTPVFADVSAQIAACRAETDSLKRLVCYDAIVVDAAVPRSEPLGPIATYKGAGTATTRPFVAPGPFVVQAEGGGAILMIMVQEPNSQFPVSTISGSPGETYVSKGGKYLLDVMAMGPWQAKVIHAE